MGLHIIAELHNLLKERQTRNLRVFELLVGIYEKESQDTRHNDRVEGKMDAMVSAKITITSWNPPIICMHISLHPIMMPYVFCL